MATATTTPKAAIGENAVEVWIELSEVASLVSCVPVFVTLSPVTPL
jgi:hypothetical protein